MRKGYLNCKHLINAKIPGVGREVGRLLRATCPAPPTLTASSYFSVCVSSPEGLSSPDPAVFSHCSVFLTTACRQGNHCGDHSQTRVFPAGKFSPYSSLHPQPPLGVTSEGAAKPQARSPLPPAGTFPQGAERRKQGWDEKAWGSRASMALEPCHRTLPCFSVNVLPECNTQCTKQAKHPSHPPLPALPPRKVTTLLASNSRPFALPAAALDILILRITQCLLFEVGAMS